MSFLVSHRKQRQQWQNLQVGPHQTPNKGTSAKSNGNIQIDRRHSKSYIWYGLNIQKCMRHSTQEQKKPQIIQKFNGA